MSIDRLRKLAGLPALTEAAIAKPEPEHVCKTPGAVYKTTIKPEAITVKVVMPDYMQKMVNNMSGADAEKLEKEMHQALEKVLAVLWD